VKSSSLCRAKYSKQLKQRCNPFMFLLRAWVWIQFLDICADASWGWFGYSVRAYIYIFVWDFSVCKIWNGLPQQINVLITASMAELSTVVQCGIQRCKQFVTDSSYNVQYLFNNYENKLYLTLWTFRGFDIFRRVYHDRFDVWFLL